MEIVEKRLFLRGMMVRIKRDLRKTYSEFGRASGDEMEQMKGKTFPIVNVGCESDIKIKSPFRDFVYTFHVDDLVYDDNSIKIKYPKPEKFNTVLLDI
jgi:hypothetical protein